VTCEETAHEANIARKIIPAKKNLGGFWPASEFEGTEGTGNVLIGGETAPSSLYRYKSTQFCSVSVSVGKIREL
jgi:hypothetical protein